MNGGREKGDVEAVTEMKRKEERVMHANAEVCGPRYVVLLGSLRPARQVGWMDHVWMVQLKGSCAFHYFESSFHCFLGTVTESERERARKSDFGIPH